MYWQMPIPRNSSDAANSRGNLGRIRRHVRQEVRDGLSEAARYIQRAASTHNTTR